MLCEKKFKLYFCNLDQLGLGILANLTIFRYLLTIFPYLLTIFHHYFR